MEGISIRKRADQSAGIEDELISRHARAWPSAGGFANPSGQGAARAYRDHIS